MLGGFAPLLANTLCCDVHAGECDLSVQRLRRASVASVVGVCAHDLEVALARAADGHIVPEHVEKPLPKEYNCTCRRLRRIRRSVFN